MDHIQLPKPPNDNHISVLVQENGINPYVYTPPWHSYPERQGYNSLDFYLMRGNTYSESFKNSFASFVQSWLYFGLIADFLGPPFDRSDWIQKTCDGINIVSTAKLPGRLDAWRKEVLEMQDAQRSHRRADLDYLLDRAHNFHAVISCGKDIRTYSDLLPQDLSLSIQILHATLVLARNSVFLDTPTSIPRHPIIKTLSDRFRSNGWCTSDVTRLRQDTSVLGEYYASRLGQLTCLRDHHLCNENTCSAFQIRWRHIKRSISRWGVIVNSSGLRQLT
jgi:hypothetical protein